MENLLPSDLCKICHASPPKYRCPRCFTRTCSLPCTTRHKKWAQCSGIRDPARYLKRAELATPAGIDHDFNFLTGIERTLERAERDAEKRGVVLLEAERVENEKSWQQRGLSGPMKGEMGMKMALQECGVVIQRAPKGMGRAKQNGTHWHKKRRTLVWTVEWILNNGTSQIGSCAANIPIAEAYALQFPTKSLLKNKKRASRPWDLSTTLPPHKTAKSTVPAEPPTNPLPKASPTGTPPPPSPPTTASKPPPPPVPTTTYNSPPLTAPAPSTNPPPESNNSPQPSLPSPLSQTPLPPPPPPLPPLNFYLLHPNTPSPTRVLIPLSRDSTLSSSLQHQTVLEFPTIYALRYSPGDLPTGFLTQEMYFRNHAGMGVVDTAMGMGVGRFEGNGDNNDGIMPRREVEQEVSEGRLIEVLARDLGG